MSKIIRAIIFVGMAALVTMNSLSNEARDNWEINNMIRSDKLDFVLPKAMRNNNIDMWLIIDKGRGTEPLFRDFADATRRSTSECTRPAISDTMWGGGLFEIYPLRTTYEIRPNSLIAFEFIVFTPAAEWGGNKLPVCVEENALITERGIEWVHPPQNRILVIR